MFYNYVKILNLMTLHFRVFFICFYYSFVVHFEQSQTSFTMS